MKESIRSGSLKPSAGGLGSTGMINTNPAIKTLANGFTTSTNTISRPKT